MVKIQGGRRAIGKNSPQDVIKSVARKLLTSDRATNIPHHFYTNSNYSNIYLMTKHPVTASLVKLINHWALTPSLQAAPK